MNKKQKTVVWIAIAIFALTLFNAPWTVIRPGTAYVPSSSYTWTSPVWDGPGNGELMIGALLIEWVAIGIIGGGLFVLFRQKH
jgi:hypothetical protein